MKNKLYTFGIFTLLALVLAIAFAGAAFKFSIQIAGIESIFGLTIPGWAQIAIFGAGVLIGAIVTIAKPSRK